jgi:hypothetical protein
MVKVSIEVHSGTARFDATVHAENIERALSLVGGSYAGCDFRVRFPIDPEGFFVKDPATPAGIAGFDRPNEMAA